MSDDKKPPWRPPTRRMFVAMLGAAAAIAVREAKPNEPARPISNGKPRWIGHC